MSKIRALSLAELPVGSMKTVTLGQTEILLINNHASIIAVQSTCPHAGAPLVQGAICNNRLVCPWHLATFELPSGELVEPPAMTSLTTYAVEIQNNEILVDTTAQPCPKPAPQTSESPVFLIVGAGAAGSMALATLRQHNFAGKIILVDPVATEPVDRTQLSKDALSGFIPLNEICLNINEFEHERITASVIDFSAATHSALLSTGQLLKFDKALLATGGTPKRLPIPGAELAHTIRHTDDVYRILSAASPRDKIVIIGTSFIGLEAASALGQRGNTVTVVGKEKIPFAKQFGVEVAKRLVLLHETNGTKFQLSAEPLRITKDTVTIRNSRGIEEHVPADLVIFGVGVNPEPNFCHDLRPTTNSPNVWTAGDIAEVNGTRIEHWRVAQQQGRIAALGMLGQNATYEGVPYFWTYHFGKRIGYIGHATEWDETIILGSLGDMEFLTLYVKDDHVRAVLNCGFETEMAALAEPMRTNPTLRDVLFDRKAWFIDSTGRRTRGCRCLFPCDLSHLEALVVGPPCC